MFENAHHLFLLHPIHGVTLIEFTSPMGKFHTPYQGAGIGRCANWLLVLS